MEPITDIEIIELLNRIFDNSKTLLALIAPTGWRFSAYVNFFHPTPKQQFEEEKALRERLNKLAKNQTPIKSINLNEYQQDDLNNISETEEFQYVLGLSVYDIFSNNHEVYSNDNQVYDLGSFRGSGSFIADFLNNKNPASKNYDYLDFYMGSVWIESRANLLPFYEYIFQILKNEKCDWNYCFPRLYLLDMRNKETNEAESTLDYKPEKSMPNEIERINKEKEIEKFQNELDSSFQKGYEDAKYKPLISIVQAYKNIYKSLPKGHPQKDFEYDL